MTRLLLARHGETDWNIQGRFQGHTNIPLNANGRKQAVQIGGALAGEAIKMAVASDLDRTMETARLIAARHRLVVRPEPGLREMCFGAWEGLTYAEIQQIAPVELQAWQADRLHTAPPGGENLLQLGQRVAAVLESLRSRYPEQTVLVVAHAGSLKALLCTALGLPLESYWKFQIERGTISELALYPEGAILNRLNSHCGPE